MKTFVAALAALATVANAEMHEMHPYDPNSAYPTKWLPKLFIEEKPEHKRHACRGRHDRFRGMRGKGKWTDRSFKDPHDKPERFERAKKMWEDEEVWERMDRRDKPRFAALRDGKPPFANGATNHLTMTMKMQLPTPRERRDADGLWRKGRVKQRDSYGYVLKKVLALLNESNLCDEVPHDEDDEEAAVAATDVNCTLPEALDAVSERITELFAAEKPEYAEKLEKIKSQMEHAKGKLEEVRQRFNLTGAQHGTNAEELETRKLRWMLKMLAGAKMGVAMHMAKWGERLRHNKFENDEFRRRQERTGHRGPFQRPHAEMPDLMAEMERKFHAKCAGGPDEEICHKKQMMMWKKWLVREQRYGDWVDVKSRFEDELEAEGVDGPDARQASTMLLRCVEAAEPRDHEEEESACIEPYNYTESVLECEEEDPYNNEYYVAEEEEGRAPTWVWFLVVVLLTTTAASLTLLYVCRCRGRAAFQRRQQEARLAAKLGIGAGLKIGTVDGQAVSN